MTCVTAITSNFATSSGGRLIVVSRRWVRRIYGEPPSRRLGEGNAKWTHTVRPSGQVERAARSFFLFNALLRDRSRKTPAHAASAQPTHRAQSVKLVVVAANREKGTCYVSDSSALSGDTGTAEGAHHVVWDLNAQGLEFKSGNVEFSVEYKNAPKPYCVIDLSAGSNATSYPVTYLTGVPSGGWTDEYKTNKLVMRFIEGGGCSRMSHTAWGYLRLRRSSTNL